GTRTRPCATGRRRRRPSARARAPRGSTCTGSASPSRRTQLSSRPARGARRTAASASALAPLALLPCRDREIQHLAVVLEREERARFVDAHPADHVVLAIVPLDVSPGRLHQ